MIIMELAKRDPETGKEVRGTAPSPATQRQLPERGSHFPVMVPICPFRSAHTGDLPHTHLSQSSRKGSVHCLNDNFLSRTTQKAWGSTKMDGVRCGQARSDWAHTLPAYRDFQHIYIPQGVDSPLMWVLLMSIKFLTKQPLWSCAQERSARTKSQ